MYNRRRSSGITVVVWLAAICSFALIAALTCQAYGQVPDLVMQDDQLRVFTQRAKRQLATGRRLGTTLSPDTERRQPPKTDILTPSPFDTPGVTREDIDTANRWCRSMGYEMICGRGDIVRRWHMRIAEGRPIDPAMLMAEEGFDSPAVDCQYTYTVENPNRMPWLIIWRNGISYGVDMTSSDVECINGTGAGGVTTMCKVTIVAPCINEKFPGTYRLTDGTCR